MKRSLLFAFCALSFCLAAVADDPARQDHATGEAARYVELRIYDVVPGKLEAVLTRFRNHMDRLYQKHGLTPIGYWVPLEKALSERFVYLLAAPDKAAFDGSFKALLNDADFSRAYLGSEATQGTAVQRIYSLPLRPGEGVLRLATVPSTTPRVFEVRIYTAVSGKLERLETRWRDSAIPLCVKHGLTHVGYWLSADNERGAGQKLVCLLANDSQEAVAKSLSAFLADDDWISAQKATEQDGPLGTKVEAIRLTPTDFSPLR
ncbi:MAG: NIPSNAP family protein [Chloroflexi bacterium]|nr:NIPSNAP family protein [Chloroflexota bacterium]